MSIKVGRRGFVLSAAAATFSVMLPKCSYSGDRLHEVKMALLRTLNKAHRVEVTDDKGHILGSVIIKDWLPIEGGIQYELSERVIECRTGTVSHFQLVDRKGTVLAREWLHVPKMMQYGDQLNLELTIQL